MNAKLLSRLGIEVWKDIPEFEGIYQVSNLGNVNSLKFNKLKVLKKSLNSNGRYRVTLCKNGYKSTNCKISQLSAMAFLNHKPCGFKIVVDHIDNNKENDKLYNLQLISNRENCSKDIKRGSSKYVGVSWHKNLNKWRTSIYIKGKIKHLGYFTDEKEAAQAYQNELKKINQYER
tara:strand:+ start:43 stop:567 length:525 start_codon:yes stop_codon:yes gene_type:complete